MTAFQFIHAETYARKTSKKGKANSNFVFNEVRRQPGACNHVEAPQLAQYVYGLHPRQLQSLHDDQLQQAFTTDKIGRKRPILKTQKTLLGIVVSLPVTPLQYSESQKLQKLVHAFESDTVQWCQRVIGNYQMSVVRHLDEEYVHFHVLMLPPAELEFKAALIHPGVLAREKAKHAAMNAGEKGSVVRSLGHQAYRNAMSEFQDDFHASIGGKYKLHRGEKGGKRLSRADAVVLRDTLEYCEREKRLIDAKARQLAQMEGDVAAKQKELAQVLAEQKWVLRNLIREFPDGTSGKDIALRIRQAAHDQAMKLLPGEIQAACKPLSKAIDDVKEIIQSPSTNIPADTKMAIQSAISTAGSVDAPKPPVEMSSKLKI